MKLIYDPDGRPGALNELIQSIGGRVFIRSAAHYSGPEPGASLVYTSSEKIASDYEERGVEVRPLEPEEEVVEDGAHSVGGGWYDVVVDGEVVDRVQGEGKALERYGQIAEGESEEESNSTE